MIYYRFVFVLLLFISFRNSQAQATAERARVKALVQTFRQEAARIPSLLLPCPMASYRPPAGTPQLTAWLETAALLQRQGKTTCAFQLLGALKPVAQQQPETFAAWQLTRIKLLRRTRNDTLTLQVIDSLLPVSRHNKNLAGRLWLQKAFTLNHAIKYPEALQAANEALLIARASRDRTLEIDALDIIGNTSRDIYRQVPEKYLPSVQQAEKLAIALHDTTRILDACRSLIYAHMYDQTSDLPVILDYMDKSLPYLRQSRDGIMWYNFVWALADALTYWPGYATHSIDLYRSLLPVARQMGIPEDIRRLNLSLGDLSVDQKQYAQAAAYLAEAGKLDSPDWEKDYFYQNQAEVQQALGNAALANEFYQKALAEKERIYLRRNNQSMTQWETRFRTREKELQIDEQQRRQWWLTGLAILLLLLVGIATFAFFRNRSQLRLLAAQKAIIEQQSAELQRLDQAKTRFFANITHEFRTPLTLILSPLERLIDELPQHQRLKTIQTNAYRLLDFINQLLDLSKLDAGMLKPDIRSGDLSIFFRQHEDSFRLLAERKQIRLDVSVDLPAAEWLFDTDKLGKILTNLMGNAMKFTPAGGEVQLMAGISQSAAAPALLQICIADSGIGIPAGQIPHIFDRFYQVDDNRTRAAGGSGIGLSLVSELVHVLDGAITVDSQADAGTCFRIAIPVEPLPVRSFVPALAAVAGQQTVAAEAGSPDNNPPDRGVLLLVEDHDDLRQYLCELFAGSYDVVPAVNGLDGLSKAQTLIPDLVITDWMMPDMDGISLCQQLKADARTSHIPLLMLTAKTATENRLISLNSGADDHLTKPFNEQELKLKVRNWLDRQQRLREHYQRMLEQPSETPPLPEQGSDFMERLFALIDANLADAAFGVEELAHSLGLNRRTLHRRLISQTGLPPTEVIRNHRLRRSIPYLKLGQPIADVAFLVGFENPSYFTKCFRETFGHTPKDVKSRVSFSD